MVPGADGLDPLPLFPAPLRPLRLATLAGDDPVCLPPFEAVGFPLDALWPEGAKGNGEEG